MSPSTGEPQHETRFVSVDMPPDKQFNRKYKDYVYREMLVQENLKN